MNLSPYIDLFSRTLPPQKIVFKNETTSFILAPFDPTFLSVFEVILKQNLEHLKRFMLWPHRPWSRLTSTKWLASLHAEYLSGISLNWWCTDLESGEFLLSTGIMPANPFNPDCWELGYWADQKHCNKGLTTLANQVLIAVAFRCFGIKRIQVSCLPENEASKRVIEKCGFHFEGEVRNFYPPQKGYEPPPDTPCVDLLYSLVPEDLHTLSWIASVFNQTHLIPLSGGTPIPLSEI